MRTNDRFSKAFKASLTVHLVVIVLLLVIPLLSTCIKPREKEQVIFLEMVSPQIPAPPDPAPEPPQPPPPKPPEPEPPKPEPVPEPPAPEPKPKEQVKKPKEIKVNTNIVTRSPVPATPPAPPAKTPSAKDIAQIIGQNLPTSSPAAPSSPTALSAYYQRIYPTLYNAWQRPPGSSGLKTVVSIRVNKNGVIMSRDFERRSGNQVMDESVMKGVRSITSLPPLPDGFRETYLDISITFESTGLSVE